MLHLKAAKVQASLLDDWQGGPNVGTLQVPITTLDEEIKKYGIPNFCKIDVEGYEAEVVSGLSIPLQTLSFEYHSDKKGLMKLRAIFDHLQSLGDYEANLIGGEDASWLQPQWTRASQLIEQFPSVGRGNFWGDCFVRLISS